MGPPYSDIELASFMSISKGYMGECGLRGGWMELVNMEPEVQTNLYKAISAMLCPTTVGQSAVACVVSTPSQILRSRLHQSTSSEGQPAVRAAGLPTAYTAGTPGPHRAVG